MLKQQYLHYLYQKQPTTELLAAFIWHKRIYSRIKCNITRFSVIFLLRVHREIEPKKDNNIIYTKGLFKLKYYSVTIIVPNIVVWMWITNILS